MRTKAKKKRSAIDNQCRYRCPTYCYLAPGQVDVVRGEIGAVVVILPVTGVKDEDPSIFANLRRQPIERCQDTTAARSGIGEQRNLMRWVATVLRVAQHGGQGICIGSGARQVQLRRVGLAADKQGVGSRKGDRRLSLLIVKHLY
jgi:hypothetical protein